MLEIVFWPLLLGFSKYYPVDVIYLLYLVSLTLESDPAHVHIHIHLLAPLNSLVSTFKINGRVVSGHGCHSESSEVGTSPLDLSADFLNFIPLIYSCFMYFN